MIYLLEWPYKINAKNNKQKQTNKIESTQTEDAFTQATAVGVQNEDVSLYIPL